MKFISLVLIIFFSLAVMDSYSIITVRIHSDLTFSGGDWSNSQSGSYTTHKVIALAGGYETCRVSCENSDDICFTATQHGQDVDITMYDLVSEGGGGSGSGIFTNYEIGFDSTGKMKIYTLIGPI